MKHKILLHTDVVRALTLLRRQEPQHQRFEGAPMGALDSPLYRACYDADELFACLNDMVYKYTREAE